MLLFNSFAGKNKQLTSPSLLNTFICIFQDFISKTDILQNIISTFYYIFLQENTMDNKNRYFVILRKSVCETSLHKLLCDISILNSDLLPSGKISSYFLYSVQQRQITSSATGQRTSLCLVFCPFFCHSNQKTSQGKEDKEKTIFLA